MVELATQLDAVYASIEELRRRVDGPRRLATCTARSGWPPAGLYLFFEEGELRSDALAPRVVRVGTHALTGTSQTTLWQRLAQHRGTLGGHNAGGGNHRGSVFRRHLGAVLVGRDGRERWAEAAETWGSGSSAPRDIRDAELPLERQVSSVIGTMPLLWLAVPDRHERVALERGLIAVLSADAERDRPSPDWLGYHADRDPVRHSGLWNVHHVGAPLDPELPERLARHVRATP